MGMAREKKRWWREKKIEIEWIKMRPAPLNAVPHPSLLKPTCIPFDTHKFSTAQGS